jgi:hypothetical protein
MSAGATVPAFSPAAERGGGRKKALFALFAAQSERIAGLVERFKGLVDPEVRTPLGPSGIWLVRPDGYVACSAKDPAVIANYLDGLVRSSPS